MKESILTGEALALNDAELEGATGGCSNSERGDGLEEHVFDMVRQVHEMYKSGGNSLVEIVDSNMSPEEIEQKYGFEISKLNEQMMQDRLNKIKDCN